MNVTFFVMLCVALTIYETYNVVMFRVLGVPDSYSDTFYRYNAMRRGLGVVFPVMLVAMCAMMMPGWLELSDVVLGNVTFLAFFGGAGLLFVAVAPFFKQMSRDTGHPLSDLVYRSFHGQGLVHTIGALMSMISCIVWVSMSPWWWVEVSVLLATIVSALATSSLKRAIVFWGEFLIFNTMIITLAIGYATCF